MTNHIRREFLRTTATAARVGPGDKEDRPGGAMRSGLRMPPDLAFGPAKMEQMRAVEGKLLAEWANRA